MPFLIEEYASEFHQTLSPQAKKLWVREFDNITRHTRKRDMGDLITKRRPNETEETKEYRMATFEHHTLNIFQRALERIQAYFTQINYSKNIPSELAELLSKKNYQGLSFDSFFGKLVTRRNIEDSNGYLVWWAANVGVIDEPIRLEPILVLSKNIHHEGEDYITWLSHEKSEVIVNKESKKEGKVYFIASDRGQYKLIQFGKKEDEKFRIELHYDYGDYEIKTFFLLGGDEASELNEETNEDVPYFTSYLSAAIPTANDCLRQYSDHSAVVVTCAHPFKEIDGVDCRACEGDGRLRQDGVPKRDWNICTNCQGTGKEVSQSPFGYLIRPTKEGYGGMEGENKSADPVLRFISAPVDNIKYMGDLYDKYYEKTEKALNLLKVEDSQSGVAKEIDREALEAFLRKIYDNIFSLMESSMKVKLVLELGNTVDNPVIVKPDSYKPKFESDWAQELRELIDGKAHPLLIANTTEKLFKAKFASDKKMLKIVDFMLVIDPFFALTEDQKNSVIGNGRSEDSDMRKSTYGAQLLNEICKEVGELNFVKMEFKDLKKRFDSLYNERFGLIESQKLRNDDGTIETE